MIRQASELSDIEAILFDKDGTLLDFHGTWLPKGRDLWISCVVTTMS